MLSCLHYSKMLQLPDTCRHAALFHCCNPCHKCLFHHRNLMMSVLLAWSWSIWICTHLSAVFPHKIFFLKKNLFEKVWLVVFCLFSEVPTKVPTLYPSKAPTNLPTCKHSDVFFFFYSLLVSPSMTFIFVFYDYSQPYPPTNGKAILETNKWVWICAFFIIQNFG